ncbi:GNAT family N-acetyltransferase [Streptomyces sp. NBC_01420]|uniref:GNAT family N-acetyltransferase n=1 Tax=Streptomyces sp. NBC_01420 TaxID=2903858 RepID=UPI0032435D36
MAMWVQPASAADVLAYEDGVRRAYAEAFAGPPWHEDPALAAGYTERLREDARRPGFRAALALSGDADEPGSGTVVGFATAWTTPAPFPAARAYAAVASLLGPERTDAWLVGALEVDELALSPHARGAGLAAALLESVTASAPGGRCWLLTSRDAEPAVRLYRRLGWHQAPAETAGSNLVVFLGPGHPGLAGRTGYALDSGASGGEAVRR